MTTVTLPPINEETAREATRMSLTWREVPAISDAVARHYLDGFRWLDVNDHATLTALDAVRGVPDDQPTTVTTQDVRVVLDVIRANDGRLSTWGREAASALLSWVVAHEAAPAVGDRIRRRVAGMASSMTGTVTDVNVQTNRINWTDDAGQDWSGSITNDGMATWWERVTPFDGAPLIEVDHVCSDQCHPAEPCPSCGVERGNHPASGCPPHGDLTVYPRGSADARLDANTGASLDSEDPARVPAWWQPAQDAPRNPMPALRFAPPTTPPIVVVEGRDLDTLRDYVQCTDPGSVRTVRVSISDGRVMWATNGGMWSRPLGRPANDRGW